MYPRGLISRLLPERCLWLELRRLRVRPAAQLMCESWESGPFQFFRIGERALFHMLMHTNGGIRPARPLAALSFQPGEVPGRRSPFPFQDTRIVLILPEIARVILYLPLELEMKIVAKLETVPVG